MGKVINSTGKSDQMMEKYQLLFQTPLSLCCQKVNAKIGNKFFEKGSDLCN